MFKFSPKVQESPQDVRGTILKVVGVLAIVGLLVALPTPDATAAPHRPQATAGSNHQKAASSM